jgi:FkbM family methyltransferase
MQTNIRIYLLKLLKQFKFDIVIKHHLTTGFSFLLNSYHHKGYWFYGINREKKSIALFRELIDKDSTVFDVGGHIGYFTTFFMYLTGEKGKVVVFEPSFENLKYLKSNIGRLPPEFKNNILLIEKGVGSDIGLLDLYIDPITGQNNSFVKDFSGFLYNRKFQAEKNVETKIVKVEVTTLDNFINETEIKPNFIKIDVEGYEWEVIQGSSDFINQNKPTLMIEIQSNELNIYNFFKGLDYRIFNDTKVEMDSFNNFLKHRTPNIFFIPRY